jgi:copper transport protein
VPNAEGVRVGVQRSRRAWRSSTVLVVAVAMMLLAPTTAWAHAALIDADPADRAILDESPAAVTLTFNESVSVPTGGVRLFDADARPVAAGPVDQPTPETVALPLDGLEPGGYVVTWRVVSDDSHPIAGVLSFRIGDGPAVDDTVIAELFGGAGRTTTGIAGPLVRALAYLGTLLAAGGALAGWWFATTAEQRAVVRRTTSGGAIIGVVASLASVVVQATALTGRLAEAFTGSVLTEILASGFGQGTALRVIWLPVLALFVFRNAPGWAQAGAGAIAAASFALDGHQRSVDPTWLLASADVIHVAAAAVWAGGLVAVARFAAPLAEPVRRFSRAALASVGVVAATGLVMSAVLVRAPRALDTPYGWTLVAKVAIVAVVIGVAVFNRRLLLPGLDTDDRASDRLRATMRTEAALLAAVLVASAALATQPPAVQVAGVGGAFQTLVPLDADHELELVVDPNRVGLNALHVYVLDAAGRPAGDVEDLVLELTYVPEQIGPISIEPFPAGPGHWIANIDDLRFAGEWRVRAVAGIGRFTEASAEVTVHVNP